MQKDILLHLKKITPEEQDILNGITNVKKDLYTSRQDFVVDSQKLLEKGHLIELRPHTRFVHFPKHRHNYVEMVYMCSGSTTHIINGTDEIVLQEGDLLFLNQNVTQEILPASEDDIAINFIILPEFFNHSLSMIEQENILRDFLISTLSQNNSPASYLHFHTKGVLPIKNLIESMIWTLINTPNETNTINQITMGLLFMNLSLLENKINPNYSNNLEQNIVFSTLKYIENHYRNGTLTDIANELKQPTYYISRLLKKHTNSTFKELLQKQKFQHASYLLQSTSLSIEAIMSAIGYDNSSYFYRKFRDIYGCSPTEFRSLH